MDVQNKVNLQRKVCVWLMMRRKKRKFWVDPIISQRLLAGTFYVLHAGLRLRPAKFLNFYRMSINSFDELLSLVENHITHQDTNMRNCIHPEERLSVTLRYLATGQSIEDLETQYLLGATTIRRIIRETCIALWDSCKDICFPALTPEGFLETAQHFYQKTQFPNCMGAVDGKHIRMKKPPNSGSNYYNYKNFFFVVLMAVADAEYCFTFIDVGAYGKFSDSNIFKNSSLENNIQNGSISLPEKQHLPNDENGKPMPFVFVGDEAFAVSSHVMRPYPNRHLDVQQRIFNYRLCRARRMVECAFGILSNKWRILHRSIDVDIEVAIKIIKATCILHNFVRKRDGVYFEDQLYTTALHNISQQGLRGTDSGIQVRKYFTDYFTSPQGSVPWQYKNV